MAFKIVFFGSPKFAVVSLQRLLESGATVAAVVTAPDRPKGRTMQVQSTPVRLLAEKASIPVLTPTDVNAPEIIAKLRALQANVFVVVAFGQIFQQEVLDIPPLGCINVHGSLLPAYRGAAPIQRAIMKGETITGVTIAQMVRKCDAGDILLSQAEAICHEDTFGTVHDRLAILGADALAQALKALAGGTQRVTPQEEPEVTYAPKILKKDQHLQWNQSAKKIHDFVRALNPVPGATTKFHRAGKPEIIKIWSVRVDNKSEKVAPGVIVEVQPTGLRVSAGEGSVWILQIQSASKARMQIGQWLQGHAARPGDRFGN